MNDDPILVLERQLVGVARRHSGRRARASGMIALAASALVVVVIAARAFALLGAHSPSAPSVTSAGSPSHAAGRQQLISLLAVLRRPQTKADLSLPELAAVHSRAPRPVLQGLLGAADVRLVRLAAIAPWGARVYLVPFRPLTGPALRHFPPPMVVALRRRAEQGESIGILARGVTPSPSVGWREVRAGLALAFVPLLPRVHHGHGLRLIELVPDGVARVELKFASHAGRAGRLIKAVGVHGNTVAFQVVPGPTRRLTLLWLAADGRLLRRVPLP